MNTLDKRNLIELLIGGTTNIATIGSRALLLGKVFECRSVQCKSQRELAQILKISEAAVSKRVKLLRRIYCVNKGDNGYLEIGG